jgi:hypothetical protein
MIGAEEIVLDDADLVFNEATLGEFQEQLALKYDYYGQKLADLQYIEATAKIKKEALYGTLCTEFKTENGGSDEHVKNNVKKDVSYVAMCSELAKATHNREQIQYHLRAWDKAHSNAESRGHTLRREMSKLNVDYGTRSDYGDQASEICGGD